MLRLTGREKGRERLRDRQTDRLTDIERDRQTETETERERERERERALRAGRNLWKDVQGVLTQWCRKEDRADVGRYGS